jgi:hypothetical protein
MQVNLGYYVFFKVILRSIYGVDSVSKPRDFLSLFKVYINGF